jgi:hypothetical protein
MIKSPLDIVVECGDNGAYDAVVEAGGRSQGSHFSWE